MPVIGSGQVNLDSCMSLSHARNSVGKPVWSLRNTGTSVHEIPDFAYVSSGLVTHC